MPFITRFPSIFGNGTIFPNFNDFLKCGCRAAESYIELDGFSLNARLVANAMKNSPQSTHFDMTFIINSFLEKMMMLRFRESHLVVFFSKTSYQKYNALD